MARALNQPKEKLIRTLRGLAIALAASFPVADTDNIAELIPLQYIGAGVVADTDNAYPCRFTFSGSGKGLRASGVLRDELNAVVDTQPAR